MHRATRTQEKVGEAEAGTEATDKGVTMETKKESEV